MNATVKRIVELMFEDTVMDDEVAAIREELLDNCQERYEDMIARGLTEDEAIAAVIESLKGMEEVIGQYPKIPREAPAPSSGDVDMTFAPHAVTLVKSELTNENLWLEASEDDLIHVLWDADELPYLRASLSDGKLSISRDETLVRNQKQQKDHKGNLWVEISGDDMKVAGDSITRIFKSLGDMVRINIRGSDEHVRVQLPDGWHGDLRCGSTSGDVEAEGVQLGHVQIRTTSGDTTMHWDVMLDELDVQSTSGNVHAEIDEGSVSLINLRTTSGDVELNVGLCVACNLQTMSGDVTLDGVYDTLNVSTVSGDVELEGEYTTVQAKTVSGDFSLDEANAALQSATVRTTSGDVEISVADSDASANVYTRTISGDVNNTLAYRGEPSVKINVQTVSGDITVA